MNKVRCAHCGSRFVPNPRIRNQRYCGKIECQRARKTSWQRQKLATDPDYQANKQDSQRAWRIETRVLAKLEVTASGVCGTQPHTPERPQSPAQSEVAKMDASEPLSEIKTGSYYVVPENVGMVAKMDASAPKVRLILMT